MTPNTLDTPDADLRRIAKRRVKLKMGWYVHLVVYVCVNLGLLALNHLAGGERWSLFPALGWGLGLAFHAYAAFVLKPREMARWEQE